jgi:hypothetical protein
MYNGTIMSEWQEFLEKSDLWRRYENTLLARARLDSVVAASKEKPVTLDEVSTRPSEKTP